MSKRLRLLIIAAAVLVVIAVVLVVLLQTPGQTDGDNDDTTTTTATQTISVFDKTAVGSDPVLWLHIQNASGEYRVEARTDGVMAVTDYPDLPVDTAGVATLTQYAARLDASSKVDHPQGAEAYGFTAPSATVEVAYTDGTEATITFGNKTPYDTGVYCRVSGNSDVYIVDSAVAEAFQASGMSLIGKNLIAAPAVQKDDTEGTAQLLDLQLSGRCRKNPLRVTLDVDNHYPGMTYVSPYILTSPYIRSVDSDLFNTVAYAMPSLTADGVAAVHPDEAVLRSYGLTEPYSVAGFTTAVVHASAEDASKKEHYGDREHMVLLGDRDENGNYYALIDRIDVVYLLSPSSVPWAEWQYIDLTSKLLFLRDIATIDTMTVMDNGATTVLQLSHHPDKTNRDEQLTVTIGGKAYITEDFRKVYQQMISVHRLAASEGDRIEGEPILSIALTFHDGSDPMTVTFYPLSASRYLLTTDDGELCEVSISDTAGFLKVYRAYIAGEAVVTPY